MCIVLVLHCEVLWDIASEKCYTNYTYLLIISSQNKHLSPLSVVALLVKISSKQHQVPVTQLCFMLKTLRDFLAKLI